MRKKLVEKKEGSRLTFDARKRKNTQPLDKSAQSR